MSGKQAKPRGSARERLLIAAEAAVLLKGFASTSIDELVAEAGITRSGFFYHFKDKNELARAMMQRFLDQDRIVLDEIFQRGDELHDDPLHAFLIGMKLFAEMLGDLPSAHPGCLAAAFCYQDQLFDAEIRAMNGKGMQLWRERFLDRFKQISARYKPRFDVDLAALADMITVLTEGGIILSRALNDRAILHDQIIQFRNYVRLLFEPQPASPLVRAEAVA